MRLLQTLLVIFMTALLMTGCSRKQHAATANTPEKDGDKNRCKKSS
jgi:nitrous oxide reductase accessory protein NosL